MNGTGLQSQNLQVQAKGTDHRQLQRSAMCVAVGRGDCVWRRAKGQASGTSSDRSPQSLLGLCACVLVCVLSPLALGLDMEDENA